MKKPDKSAGIGGGGETPLDARFAKDYPTLWLYMTDMKWDDGTPRVPSAVSIFVDDGQVKVSVADKDLKRSLYTSGETVQDALKAAEKALNSSAPDWKRWGASTKKK